jgi:hypothetical protein
LTPFLPFLFSVVACSWKLCGLISITWTNTSMEMESNSCFSDVSCLFVTCWMPKPRQTKKTHVMLVIKVVHNRSCELSWWQDGRLCQRASFKWTEVHCHCWSRFVTYQLLLSLHCFSDEVKLTLPCANHECYRSEGWGRLSDVRRWSETQGLHYGQKQHRTHPKSRVAWNHRYPNPTFPLLLSTLITIFSAKKSRSWFSFMQFSRISQTPMQTPFGWTTLRSSWTWSQWMDFGLVCCHFHPILSIQHQMLLTPCTMICWPSQNLSIFFYYNYLDVKLIGFPTEKYIRYERDWWYVCPKRTLLFWRNDWPNEREIDNNCIPSPILWGEILFWWFAKGSAIILATLYAILFIAHLVVWGITHYLSSIIDVWCTT